MESSAAKYKAKKNQSGSMKKLYLLLFTLILVILLFSGCWDWEELNDITIVSGIGLDETEEPGTIRLTAQVIKPAALGIYRAVQTAAANAFAPDITIQDTNKRLASDTTELVAPLTKLYVEEGIGKEKKTRIDIAGTAVFRGDKMVGTLNRKETRGLHWILDEVETGIIVIEHAGGKESLEIVKAESKMTPEIKNNELVVKINLDVNTYLGDQQCEKNLTDPTEIALLEKKLVAEIRTEITGVVKKAQELKADICGFGN